MRVGPRTPAQKGLRSVRGLKFWGRCRRLAESVFKGGSVEESELICSPGMDFTRHAHFCASMETVSSVRTVSNFCLHREGLF